MKAGAVLVAAGRGLRTGRAKQFELLAGRPLFTWALSALTASTRIDAIVVTVPHGVEGQAADLAALSGTASVQFVAGGERRQDSVRLGLEALPPCDWVVVHDAARPFLTADLVDRALDEARLTGAASAGTPMTDAVKRVSDDRLVVETVAREGLWTIQTPQAFRTELLREAHAQVTVDVPDDAALIEMIGGRVLLFEGPRGNMKITSMEDFSLAEALMRATVDA